mgnify:CR=1 FL=1
MDLIYKILHQVQPIIATMQAAARDLNIWRIQCVCHILNLIFKEFIDNCSDTLQTFFSLLESLTKSSEYTV